MKHEDTCPASDQLVMRNARGDDYNFIYSTMIKSLLKYSPHVAAMKASRLASAVKDFIDQLSDENCIITVAALKDEPDAIVGYVLAGKTSAIGFDIASGQPIHFVYVKGPFRRMGIAEFMLASRGITPRTHRYEFTHWTNRMGPICAKFKNLEFNPYAR